MAEALYKPFWAAEAVAPAPTPLPDGPLADVLRFVPQSVPLDLSEHQIAVLNQALARRRRHKKHSIDYRGGLRWFGRHYYFSFLAGPEGRRLHARERLSPRRLIIKVGSIVGMYMLLAAMAFPLLLALYFIKTLAGIDLFEGHSVLHNFIFW